MRALLLALLISANALAFDCLESPQRINGSETKPLSLTEDFPYRETLPQTEIARTNWESCCGRFGPCPMSYPAVAPPEDSPVTSWLPSRVESVAKKYLGLPYLHKHIPAAGGLDCSNFTAWVYNWGLGIRFSSNVVTQSQTAGRKLDRREELKKGDLLYFWDPQHTHIAHAAIYLGEGLVIEARGKDIHLVTFEQNKNTFAWARRIIESN